MSRIFLAPRQPPTPTLFPYTTLFRSQVRGRRKIDRGRAAPAPQHGRHMDGDTDLFPRGEAAGVALTPVGAGGAVVVEVSVRSEEHTSELQSLRHLVCRLLLEKKKEEY